MGPELMREFQIDAYMLGSMSGLFYVSYSLLQIPLGICLDLIGPRRVILTAAVVSLVGTAVFATSSTIAFASLGRLLIGAGSAAGFLGSMKIASSWFRPAIFAVLVGVTSFLGVIGAMVGAAPLAVLVSHYGWRHAMIWLLALGTLVLFGLFIGVRDNPKDRHVRSPGGFWNVLTHGQVWLIGFFGLAVYSPITVLADLWGTQFVATLFAIPTALAAGSVSLLYIGFGVGAFGIGWLASSVPDIRRFFRWVAFAVFILLTAIIWLPHASLGVISLLLLIMGFACSGECLIFSSACQYAPLAYSGTVTGFVNMFTMIGGSLLQPLVGYLMQWTGQPSMFDGVPIYTADDYRLGLTALLVLLVLAFIASFLMKRPSEVVEERKR